MGNVNATPRGLVSFLSLITDGKTPDVLVGTLQATLDLTEFFLHSKVERVQAAQAIAPNSLQIFTDPAAAVPAGELWYVRQFSVQGTLALASQTIRLTPFVRSPANFNYFVGDPVTSNSNAVNIVAFAGVFARKPFLALGGTTFGVLVSDCTNAGNVQCQLDVEFARLRG